MMKKYSLTLCVTLLMTASTFAQKKFKPGSYVNNSGVRIAGLILAADWRNNPDKFIFKTGETASEQTISVNEAASFEITGMAKYLRANVKMDKTGTDINRVSPTRDPVLTDAVVFLKYVVDGKADLLMYENGQVRRYFMSVDGSQPEQLIHKFYETETGKVGENKDFIKQLSDKVRCNATTEQINALDYKQNELRNHFIKYNRCVNADVQNMDAKNENYEDLNLSVKAGASFVNAITKNWTASEENINFGGKVVPRIAAELEYVPRFANNKWSLFIEPAIQFGYRNTRSIGPTNTAIVEYQSAQLTTGLRHKIFTGGNGSNVFLNAAVLMDFPYSSSRYQSLYGRKIDFDPHIGYSAGLGYRSGKKLSGELRYTGGINHGLSPDLFEVNFSMITFTIAYSIF